MRNRTWITLAGFCSELSFQDHLSLCYISRKLLNQHFTSKFTPLFLEVNGCARQDNQISLLYLYLVINGTFIRIKRIFIKKSLLLGTYSLSFLQGLCSLIFKRKDTASTLFYLEDGAAHLENHIESKTIFFWWHVILSPHIFNIAGSVELLTCFRLAMFYLSLELQRWKTCMAVTVSCGWLDLCLPRWGWCPSALLSRDWCTSASWCCKRGRRHLSLQTSCPPSSSDDALHNYNTQGTLPSVSSLLTSE